MDDANKTTEEVKDEKVKETTKVDEAPVAEQKTEEPVVEQPAEEAPAAEEPKPEEIAAPEKVEAIEAPNEPEIEAKEEEGDVAPAEEVVLQETAPEEKAEEVKPHSPADDAKWYIVHTYSGHENKVAKSLKQRIESMGFENRIFDIIVPVRDTVKVSQGKKENVKEKIFPGYVLVKMILDDESWLLSARATNRLRFPIKKCKPSKSLWPPKNRYTKPLSLPVRLLKLPTDRLPIFLAQLITLTKPKANSRC
jgi:transcriptional antiterminator NusG